jgi:hypothetical protein
VGTWGASVGRSVIGQTEGGVKRDAEADYDRGRKKRGWWTIGCPGMLQRVGGLPMVDVKVETGDTCLGRIGPDMNSPDGPLMSWRSPPDPGPLQRRRKPPAAGVRRRIPGNRSHSRVGSLAQPLRTAGLDDMIHGIGEDPVWSEEGDHKDLGTTDGGTGTGEEGYRDEGRNTWVVSRKWS